MKIRKYIAKIICPEVSRETEFHVKQIDELKSKIKALIHLNDLEKKYEKYNPTPADLMRENLKLITIDSSTRNPPDYLGDIEDDANRKSKVARVNDLWENEMFHEIYRHLVNKQANFTLKEAVNDAEIFSGRMNINGIMLFRDEVERCHALFEDMVKPEDFNQHEVV